ncbi:MAG: adenylate/guanylate cyclase domain-containing protein [Anaerolineales bacterium]|nr:MAG: adenylate/guanylate cyclase domain-containing protein [Anaerolineales bacterium]
MDPFSAYIPIDRRHALASGQVLPEAVRGAVLVTDISGFTKLTEALMTALGFQRGAEELGRHLNNLYGVLIEKIHRYHGSVVLSGGDSLLSWFDGDEKTASHRAVSAAFAMQNTMKGFSVVSLPNGGTAELAIKSAAACGMARRFLVGDPDVQVFDVLAGSLLDKVDAAETLAHRGEIVVTAETAQMLGNEADVLEQRQAGDGSTISVIGRLNRMSNPQPWDAALVPGADQVRPWLHPLVYKYISDGQEQFLSQLRPSVSMFMHFDGIDYDADLQAGKKLNALIQLVQKNATRYGGTLIDITTGDKGSYFYIAVGALYAHEDDPARGVALAHTLLEIPAELDHVKNIQIGVSRGTIWSGSVGNDEWRKFSVIGNEVNVAARLMQIAAPGTMLVTQRIADATRSSYQWKPVDEVSIKGLSKPVTIFETIDTKNASRTDKLFSASKIIGREAERALLKDMLQQIDANSSNVVVIEGEAGIGKSRLISDLIVHAQENAIPIVVGAGYAIEQSTPYHAWRPVFEAILGLDAADDGERRREKAREWLRAHDASLLDRAPLLSPVLSLDTQDNSLTKQMTGQVRAENTRSLLIAILRLFIGDAPKLLVLEDTHWFDSSSLALAVEATRSLTNIMVAITTRRMREDTSEYLGIILDQDQTRHILLDQMNQADIEALICQRLNVKRLPEQVMQLILSKAEGHPFFSEELASTLHESGVIRVENGECWVAPESDLRALNFPDTVQGVVRSRIDRLPPSHQLALKAASVVGRIFALRAVHEIYPLASDKPRIGTYFEYLRKLDFTPLNSEIPDLTYLFKHVITQEVAYNLMTFSQRQAFHQAVANWYEQAFADDLSPYYGVLAYHWLNAKNQHKAVEYLEKAGEQAMRNFANREAIEFFEEALRLTKSGEVQVTALQRAHWERQLAEAHYGLGELPHSLAHLKRALNILGWKTSDKGFGMIASLLGEAIKQVRFRINPKPIEDAPLPSYLDNTETARLLEGAMAFVRIGQIYFQMNQPVMLISSVLSGLNLAERSGLKSPSLVRSYASMCVVSGVLPKHDWATAYRDRSHVMGRDVNDLPALSYALAGCAIYELGAALWDDGIKSIREAIEIDARIGDMRHYDESKSILSIMLFHQGEFDYGLETIPEVLERATRRKDVIPQVWSHTLRAEIILRQSKAGTLAEAIEGYETSLKLLEQNIDLASDIRASGALALAYWRNNDPLRALDLATATAKKTSGNPTAPYAIEGYAGVAEVFLSAWELGDAKQRASAQKACKAMGKFAGVFPLGTPRLTLYQGWFHWLDGNPEKARREWEASLAEAERANMPYEQARALMYLGQYILSGDEKITALTRSLELFNRLEVQYEAERVKSLLG